MKILLSIMISLSFFSPLSQGETLYVIATFCNIYQTAEFTTPLLDDNGKKIIFKHGDKFLFLEEEGDFYKVQTENNFEGYVYKHYLATKINSQEIYPVFNGKVLTENAVIFNADKSESGYHASLNQEIYIYGGFDSKKEFTEIAIVLEDKTLFYGLIKTKDIQAYGISSALVTSIIIIIALVTIILSVIFIQKKKLKKQKS